MREVVSPVWAFEGSGARVRSVHLISNEWVTIRQDGGLSLSRGQWQSLDSVQGPISRSWLVPRDRGFPRAGLQQELAQGCPRSQAGSGSGGRHSTLVTPRETKSPGKFLLNELLCEIREKPFPPQTLQLSGTSSGK